jgi:hypothetical protein
MDIFVVDSNVDKEQHHEEDDADEDEVLDPRTDIDQLQHCDERVTILSCGED